MREQQEQSPKEEAWEKATKDVETDTDGVGRGIDDGIKEAIVAMRVNDFETEQSCEGGEHDEHGQPYPWIRFSTPEPEGWEDNEGLKNEWKRANEEQRTRLAVLLEEFSAGRETPEDVRLTLEDHGIYGAFEIHSQGGEAMKVLPPEAQKQKRLAYRQEMDDFTAFLKSRFFLKE